MSISNPEVLCQVLNLSCWCFNSRTCVSSLLRPDINQLMIPRRLVRLGCDFRCARMKIDWNDRELWHTPKSANYSWIKNIVKQSNRVQGLAGTEANQTCKAWRCVRLEERWGEVLWWRDKRLTRLTTTDAKSAVSTGGRFQEGVSELRDWHITIKS